MTKALTKQVPVRLDEALLSALKADAERNGRTVAQSVRHLLRQALPEAGRLEAQ